MAPYVVIAPVTSDGQLVAERHFRPGAREVTLTLPSGYIDESEEPLTAAMRELREETGHEATRLLPLGRFVVDGNRGCGVTHLFLAEFAQQVAQPDGKDLAEVSVELISVAEFLKALENDGNAELATAAAVGLAILRQEAPNQLSSRSNERLTSRIAACIASVAGVSSEAGATGEALLAAGLREGGAGRVGVVDTPPAQLSCGGLTA